MGVVNENCSNASTDLNSTELRNTNLAYSVTGGVGVLLAASILLGLLCARAYKTVLQRLFLYTVLTVIVQESIHLANLEELYHYDQMLKDRICGAIGFARNWSAWSLYLLYLVMILYLLLVVCVQVQSRSHTLIDILSRSKFLRVLLEFLTVTAAILGPGVILWVPYRDQQYGLTGYYCTLKPYNVKSCAEFGFAYRFIYVFLFYELLGSTAVITAVVLIVVYCALSARLQHAKHMIKHLGVLLTAIILNMIILNLLLGIELIFKSHYGLNVVFAIFATMNDFIFLSGYLLTFHCFKLCNIAKKYVRREKFHKHRKEYGSYKESDRTTVPSATYYNVGYTGGFTDITHDVT